MAKKPFEPVVGIMFGETDDGLEFHELREPAPGVVRPKRTHRLNVGDMLVDTFVEETVKERKRPGNVIALDRTRATTRRRPRRPKK